LQKIYNNRDNAGRAVVDHHQPALDAQSVEPGDSSAEKADHRWLLLIRQYLDVGQACGVIDGNMDPVVADAVGATLLAITGDAVALLPEPRQRLHVDMNQVARVRPLVPLRRWFGFQVPQSPQPQTAESPGNAGEGRLEQPGDVA